MRHVDNDAISDSGRTFSDPDAERCYKCSGRAAWNFTCPECHSQRMSDIIDLPLEESEKLPRSKFILCKKCVGIFRCPFCNHLAEEDDVSTISDDYIPPEARDSRARGSDDIPPRDERPEAMVRYVADPHDDGIWCILDDGALHINGSDGFNDLQSSGDHTRISVLRH